MGVKAIDYAPTSDYFDTYVTLFTDLHSNSFSVNFNKIWYVIIKLYGVILTSVMFC